MTVMDDPAKPKITPNHQTLTTKFLDARNLKKLKNNLKSLGIQNKRLNHYLQTTYKIINDLESAQAEHRRRPKRVRPADKEYVNTVEFVRLVAEIVAGHILKAVCGGSEASPKDDDDGGIAQRLLNELSSHTGTADGDTPAANRTHGDHIRLGVVNAVAELLTAAKRTGGLPEVENAAKTTTLSPEAEAERRRRGAAAAASLAAGKNNYDYCDTRNKSNRRVQASRNIKYEIPNFARRKSNHRRADAAAAVNEKWKSPAAGGIKNGAKSETVIKAPVRPKPDKSGSRGKEQKTASMQNNVARQVPLEKTIGSRAGQKRPTNVIRNVPKVDARKTVGGEGLKSGKSNNINAALKSRDRISRQTAIGDNAVNNNIRSQKPSDVVKNNSRRKPAVDVEPKTGKFGRIGTRKPKSNVANPTSNTVDVKVRWAATKDDRKKIGVSVPAANATGKYRKPASAGALEKEDTGTRGKAPLVDVEGNDDKPGKLIRNKAIPSGGGVVGKSKTASTGNGGAAIVEKSKTAGTRNGGAAIVEKSKTTGTRNGGGTMVEKSKTTGTRNGGAGIVDKSITAGTRNTGSVVEKSKNRPTGNDVGKPRPDGKRDKTATPSKTPISPVIDNREDASLTVTRDEINEPVETKRILSAAETIRSMAPADVRDDHDGGGRNGKDHIFDDRVNSKRDLVETGNDQVESGTKKAQTGVYDTETIPHDTGIRQNKSETERNNIGEGCTGQTTTSPTAAAAVNGAGSCTDHDKYKLRMCYVLDQLNQCRNLQTGLYHAQRKCSKYEVTNLTKEEYCKLKNDAYKQIKK